jgi:5-methylcytosine-specific restriction enzyme B
MELDPKVLWELNSVFDKLNSEGKLMSETLLTGYYDIFWKMFGPEKLKQLWGELLLETIYGESSENRGSLVYWLEYKGEEGLPWAGRMDDALGFGLCRSKETGVWVACSGARQVRLSVEEAVGYAVRHRDQLVSGAELLQRLREYGTDEDYRVLQEEMDKIAPDVSNTEWAHRYFSMLYPEKLDCYHGVDRQRYHLMKLLQVPAEGRGRYFLAGRFVALAGELGISMNNLTRVLDYRNGRPHTYWRIGTTDGAKPRNRWSLMQDGGCIAIGWPDLGDLSGYQNSLEGIDGVKALMGEKYYPESASAAGKKGLEAFRFTFVIPEGGLALACDGETVLGIGRVTGPYYYLEGADFPHRRQVEWLSFQEWKLPKAEGGCCFRPLRTWGGSGSAQSR